MRLLVVEDETDLVNAIMRGLRRQGYAVDVANDGQQGLFLAEVNDYDLLILDLGLPGLDGLEVCRQLRTSQSRLMILILTARTRPEQRVAGLDAGADDYLLKPFHFEELAARVRALLRRDLAAREPVLQCADLRLDPSCRAAWQGNRRLRLTLKELRLLEYLMHHPGEVISQELLLEHLWDSAADPFTNTMRVHINSLRRKLGDDAAHPRYIETLIGQGYRLKDFQEQEGNP